MATRTTASSGVASNPSTWVGGVVPGPDDDVVVAGHTLTLDGDLVYVSLTLSATTSRLAIAAGSVRKLTLSGEFRVTAAITATAITVSSGELTVEVVGGIRATTNLSQPVFTASGTGTLNLTPGDADADLIVPATAVSFRLFSLTGASARVNTLGRLSCSSGTHQIVTLAGGVWNHFHEGETQFLSTTSTAKLIFSSGSITGTVNIEGQFTIHTPASTTGVISLSNSATTNTISGDIRSTNTNSGGAVLYCAGGTTILNGKISHPAGTNSLTVWVAASCNFRWRQRTVIIEATESVTIYCQAGYVDLTGLIVHNNNRFLIMFVGSGNGGATDAVIYNGADAGTGINLMDVNIVYETSEPPILPDPQQVQAGVIYGYALSPVIGTGLILDPQLLEEVVATALTQSFPAVVNANVVQLSNSVNAAGNLALAYIGSDVPSVNISGWLGFPVSGLPITTANVADQLRSAIGLPTSDLGQRLDAIATDTYVTIPNLINNLETGGATADEIWQYLVDATGDPAVDKIAAVVRQPGPETQAVNIVVRDHDANPVKAVRLWIVDTSESTFTDVLGHARFFLPEGVYQLRADVPFGHQPLQPLAITVSDVDQSLEMTLTRLVSQIDTGPGMCLITLRVINESGEPLVGATVQHRLSQGSIVLADDWLVNAVTSATTDTQGIVLLTAARLQDYAFTVTLPGGSRATIERRIPDLPAATLSMMVEV